MGGGNWQRTWVKCGPSLQAWFVVYLSAGPQVHKSAGPHFTHAQSTATLTTETTHKLYLPLWYLYISKGSGYVYAEITLCTHSDT